MKTKIYLILILFIGLQSCKKNKNDKSDTEILQLKDKVKSTTDNTFDAIEKFGEITKGNKNGNLFNKEDHQQIYNIDGYLIEENNHAVYTKLSKKYNKKNKVIEVETFDENGKSTGKTINVYDKNENEIEYNQYYQNKLIAKGKFLYDENGNRIEHKYYDKNGSLQSIQKNSFDNNNNIIGFKNYDADGILGYSYKYIFDKSGNKIESISYNSLGEINYKTTSSYNSDNLIIEHKVTSPNNSNTEKYTYKFDSNKNWIQKITFINDKPETITERKIQYY